VKLALDLKNETVAPPKLSFVNSASFDMTNSEVAITQENTPEGILKKEISILNAWFPLPYPPDSPFWIALLVSQKVVVWNRV
jgi:hypothetical protein